MNKTRSKTLPLLLSVVVLASALSGCHNDSNGSSNFASMNRADQVKAMQGDKEKQQAMAAAMAARYSGKK